MVQKNLIFVFGLLAAFAISGINAGIEDNEVQEDIHMYQGVAVYQIDRECAMVGGLCVQRRDCYQTTSKSGLCPSNQFRGVECCYEIPVRPAPCSQHAGMCMPRCHKTLMRPGTDCSNGEVCCVLV